MKASSDVDQIGVDNAGNHLCGIDRGVLSTQEAWGIAAVAKEELLLKASVGISECAALRLEEWAEAFAGCDDIEEPHKEVVIGKQWCTFLCSVDDIVLWETLRYMVTLSWHL